MCLFIQGPSEQNLSPIYGRVLRAQPRRRAIPVVYPRPGLSPAAPAYHDPHRPRRRPRIQSPSPSQVLQLPVITNPANTYPRTHPHTPPTPTPTPTRTSTHAHTYHHTHPRTHCHCSRVINHTPLPCRHPPPRIYQDTNTQSPTTHAHPANVTGLQAKLPAKVVQILRSPSLPRHRLRHPRRVLSRGGIGFIDRVCF